MEAISSCRRDAAIRSRRLSSGGGRLRRRRLFCSAVLTFMRAIFVTPRGVFNRCANKEPKHEHLGGDQRPDGSISAVVFSVPAAYHPCAMNETERLDEDSPS